MKRAYGLDLGVRHLALVGIAWEENHARVETVRRAGPFGGERRTPREDVEEETFQSGALAALRSWRREHRLDRHPLVVSLPILRGDVFELRVPAREEHQVANLLDVEIGVREARFGGTQWWRALATAPADERHTRARVALQRRGVVTAYTELLRAAHLRPDRLVAAPHALAELLSSDHRTTRPSLIVELGPDVLQLVVADADHVHARARSFGLHRLTRLLELEGLPGPRARERRDALARGERPVTPEETRAVTTYVDELGTILEQLPGERDGLPLDSARRTLLCGLGTQLPGLSQRIGAQRGHPVEALTSFRVLRGDSEDSVRAAAVPTATGAAIAAALGKNLPTFLPPRIRGGKAPLLRLLATSCLLIALALWQVATEREGARREAIATTVSSVEEREAERLEAVERARAFEDQLASARRATGADLVRQNAAYGGFFAWSRLPEPVRLTHARWQVVDEGSELDAVLTFPWSREFPDLLLGTADRLVALATSGQDPSPWRRVLGSALEHGLLTALNAGFGDALESFQPPRLARRAPARFVSDPLGTDRLSLAIAWSLPRVEGTR